MAEVNKLSDSGVKTIFAGIDGKIAGEVVEWILEHNMNDRGLKNLTLIIHSPGGSVTAGFAIIDAMRGSRLPVHTIGLGMIASMGLLIFMSGAEGHRVLTPNTSVLSHQFAGMEWGKEHELLASQRHHSQISDRIIAHYKKCTGLDEDVIKEKLLPASDMWLTAKEAKKYNICDSIKELK